MNKQGKGFSKCYPGPERLDQSTTFLSLVGSDISGGGSDFPFLFFLFSFLSSFLFFSPFPSTAGSSFLHLAGQLLLLFFSRSSGSLPSLPSASRLSSPGLPWLSPCLPPTQHAVRSRAEQEGQRQATGWNGDRSRGPRGGKTKVAATHLGARAGGSGGAWLGEMAATLVATNGNARRRQ